MRRPAPAALGGGASLMQKLLLGKVRGQWRFIPRNSKKVENSLHICVDFR